MPLLHPMTEHKYFRRRPVTSTHARHRRKPEQERLYDLVLTDIIESRMNIREACRKHGVNHFSFTLVLRTQRDLGLVVPVMPNGREKNKYDANGIYKYWVEISKDSTEEIRQTEEFGKMMDTLIQQHIDGEILEVLSERYGISAPTLTHNIARCRKAGSPIPHLPARAWQTKRGEGTGVDPDIFYFSDGHNKVKPHIVLEWVDKRLQGYSCEWIAGQYGVNGRTVSRRTKPYITL
jgi:hypothetical protein